VRGLLRKVIWMCCCGLGLSQNLVLSSSFLTNYLTNYLTNSLMNCLCLNIYLNF
jgi:hypothetical protein